jgi:filamentous hemagglutinin family protein
MKQNQQKNKAAQWAFTVRRTAVATAVAACFSGAVLANPTAPTVVHGTASFSSAGNILNITNSPNAIINWGSFSIGVNELTRFIQQSGSSAVLNRVIGQDPSAILGALQSNGRVFLINPNGIVFGAGAQINVAGLVASTLNLSNDDFLNNRMKFTDGAGAGSVVNQGSITGGSVYLIGKAVSNDGLITSPNGEVILAAGNSVELVNPGTPNLRVEITAPDNEAKNLGTITADAGRIGIYAGLINNSGTLRADSAVAEGGRIVLKASKNVHLAAASQTSASGTSGGRVDIQAGDTAIVEGDIAATGSAGSGGTVQVLGNLVGLTGHANIDASGNTQGGTVLVGGDFQGKNPDVQNAFRTYVGPDVTIHADAITQGDGGKVIVWADDATRFYGNISARGGANGGDGGFAEVSGKNALDYQGLSDLRAVQGVTGTLLLDPNSIHIVSDLVDIPNTPYTGPVLFGDAPTTLQLKTSALSSQTANIVLQANNDINVDTPVFLTSAGQSINLQAGGHLNVNGSITTSGGAITLAAGAGAPQSVGALLVNAGLDSTGAGAVSAGADINLSSTLSSSGNSVRIHAPVNAGAAGNVIIVDTGGSIQQNASGVITAHGLAASAINGDVLLNAANNQVDHFAALAGNVSSMQNRQVQFKNTRNLSLEAVGTMFGGIVASTSNSYGGTVNIDVGSNSLTRTGTAPIRVDGNSTSNITINAASIGQSGPNYMDIAPAAGAGTVNLTATTGGIYINQMLGSGDLRLSRYTVSAPAGQMIALASSGGHINVGDASAGTAFNFSELGGDAELMLATTGANDIVFANAYGGSINFAKLYLAPATGKQVQFPSLTSGSWTINAPTQLFDQNRTMHINGATVNFVGGLDASSDVLLISGAANFNANSFLTKLNVSNGTLGGSGLLDVDEMTMSGGTATNTGNIIANTSLDWSGGIIGGSGQLITPIGSTADITGIAVLGAGKVWNNTGAVNLSGQIDLGDTAPSTFNNLAGGIVNISTPAATNYSFFSNPNQDGVINNAGTINLNSTYNSWEAAYNNLSAGTLNIGAGNTLSMQNGQNIAGTVNIGTGGTLWVSERRGVDTFFNGTTISGTGTVQVIGGFSPVAIFTNVSASGVKLLLGSGGTVRIANGTSTFGLLDTGLGAYGGGFGITNGTFQQSAGDLLVPPNSVYSGAVGYVAQGGNLLVNGNVTHSTGDMTFSASSDLRVIGGGSILANNINLSGANVLIGDGTLEADVTATAMLNISTPGSLKLMAGSGVGAFAAAGGSIGANVSASGDIVLTGGSGANAYAVLWGNPDVVLSKVGGAIYMDAGSGAGSYAAIESVSPTTIYATFPSLASGGYFVNGVEGTVYDAATSTGFTAGGSPAVLGSSLKVTYGGGAAAFGGDTLETPTQTLIVALGESTEPPEAEKDKDVFKETEDDKKKDAPVCR